MCNMCEIGLKLCDSKKKEGVLPSELSELLDCPFCGIRPVEEAQPCGTFQDQIMHSITCVRCKYYFYDMDEKELIKKWNTRAFIRIGISCHVFWSN